MFAASVDEIDVKVKHSRYSLECNRVSLSRIYVVTPQYIA